MDTLSVGSKQYTPFLRATVPSTLFFFQEGKGKSKVGYKTAESQGFCVSPKNSEIGICV